MKRTLFIFLLLVLVHSAVGYRVTSDSFELTKSQEGYGTFNSTGPYTISSAFYEQNVNTSFTKGNYDYCEGFYCIYKAIEGIPSITPGGGSVAAKRACNENQTLVLINNTQVCLGEPELLEIKDRLSIRDLRAIIIIMLLVTSIMFVARRMKKRFEDYKFKKNEKKTERFKKKEINR